MSSPDDTSPEVPEGTPETVGVLGDPGHRMFFEAYLEHARWLYEINKGRSSHFNQNAIAVLGFDGVILAIVGAFDFSGITGRAGVYGALSGILAIVIITLSAAFALLAVWPRSAPGPAADEVTITWRELHEDGVRNEPAQLFAEQLLRSNQEDNTIVVDPHRFALKISASSPLEGAQHDATSRGRWFALAAFFLGLGTFMIAFTTGVVLVMGGGDSNG